MSSGTARPKGQQSVYADSVLRTPHTVAQSRPEVLIRKLAATPEKDHAAILAYLRKDGSTKALAAAGELERRWSERPVTRVSGPWRVVPVVLTGRARPKGITRDGDKEATRDGQQWRVTYNGTFEGYAQTEAVVEEMLGDAYDDLEEA